MSRFVDESWEPHAATEHLIGASQVHFLLPNVKGEPRGVRHKPSSSNEKAGASGLALSEIEGPVPALALTAGSALSSSAGNGNSGALIFHECNDKAGEAKKKTNSSAHKRHDKKLKDRIRGRNTKTAP